MDTETNMPPTTTPSTVTLTVDVNELGLIMGGLQELPHRVVDPILKKLFQQAQSQLGQPQG